MHFAGSLVLAVTLITTSQGQALTAQYQRIEQNYATLQQIVGKDLALDIAVRAQTDVTSLQDPQDRAPDFPSADWDERLLNVASLDVSLIQQAFRGASDPIPRQPGLYERLMRSSVDGKFDSYAIYIPPSAGAGSPVVLLLHGRPQTEGDLLSMRYFRALADRTHAILIAPWGRGLYDFTPPADSDAYTLLESVTAALHLDRRRTYLAGYSMGGFALFKVSQLIPERWAALLCISGAILNSEAPTFAFRFKSTPVYVVGGANDENIPPADTRATAIFLHLAGVPVSYYLEPRGTHYLPTLVPALSAAWGDMLDNIQREPVGLDKAMPLTNYNPAFASGLKP